MTKNSYSKDDVILKRLNTKWTELPTTYLKADNKLYYFESTTHGFSYFAITVKEEETPQAEEESEDETGGQEATTALAEPSPPAPGVLDQESKRKLTWLWILIGLIVIALAVISIVIIKRKKAAQKQDA